MNTNLNLIFNEDDESPLPKVSKYKIELHANIAQGNVKVVKNLIKNIDSSFFLTKDRLGLNTLEFSKLWGTKEIYHLIQEKIIKDRQGILSCFKNFNHKVY